MILSPLLSRLYMAGTLLLGNEEGGAIVIGIPFEPPFPNPTLDPTAPLTPFQYPFAGLTALRIRESVTLLSMRYSTIPVLFLDWSQVGEQPQFGFV